MKGLWFWFCFCLFLAFNASAQKAKIAVPTYIDRYSQLVAKLESGDVNVDYRELRFSFLDSKQFDSKNKQKALFDSLDNQMFCQARNRNYDVTIAIAQRLLSIDYTYLYAQKYLYQTYRNVGDSVNMRKYKRIEMGLLKSIFNDGDGHSCETCWEVSQVYEEYFVLYIMDATRLKQSIVQCPGHICDNLEVRTDNGETKNYYFEVTKMLTATEQRLNGKK